MSAATTIWVGSPSPPGKCVSSNFWPTTDSGFPVKVSIVPIPSAFKVGANEASSNKNAPETIHARLGFFSITLPTLLQVPDITWSSPSKLGRLGQKIQRPNSRSKAGNKVRIVNIETTIPMAPIGPRLAVLVN